MSDYLRDPVVLRVSGLHWTGWTSVSVTRRLDAVSGSFNLGLTDRASHGGEALPLTAGLACELLIGAEPILTGYINTCSPAIDAGSHSISVSGRDRSADLVDCSALHSPGHWLNQDALRLCRTLAAPFGVPVRSEGDVGASFPSFKLEQGETAFEAMDRALKQRELLAYPDGAGGLVLARVGAGVSQAALTLGDNVKRAEVTLDDTDRYAEYIVQGQQPGSDEVYGAGAAQVAARVADPAVRRYRPLLLRAENRVDAAAARQRAAWERSVRAARSVTVSVTVQGFRQRPADPASPLWQINALVGVDLPALRLKQDLLISAVTYRRDESGSLTELELRDPKAYQPAPREESLATALPTASTGTAGPLAVEADAGGILAAYHIDSEEAAQRIRQGLEELAR